MAKKRRAKDLGSIEGASIGISESDNWRENVTAHLRTVAARTGTVPKAVEDIIDVFLARTPVLGRLLAVAKDLSSCKDLENVQNMLFDVLDAHAHFEGDNSKHSHHDELCRYIECNAFLGVVACVDCLRDDFDDSDNEGLFNLGINDANDLARRAYVHALGGSGALNGDCDGRAATLSIRPYVFAIRVLGNYLLK